MKKYVQKFSGMSSTTKLFFFIFILIVVVLFASSGIFIQYKNRQKSKDAGVIATIAATNQSKSQIKSVVNSTTPANNQSTDRTSGTSEAAAGPVSEASAANTSCTTEVVKFTTLYKEANWLNKAETSTTRGQDGFIKTCPGDAPAQKAPVDQIIYRGTKVVPSTPSLLDTTLDTIKSIKI